MTTTDTSTRSTRQKGDVGWRSDRQNPGKYNVFGPTEVVKPGEVVTVASRDGRKRNVLVDRVSRTIFDSDTGEECCYGYIGENRGPAVGESADANGSAQTTESSTCPTCGQKMPENAADDEFEEPF